MFRPHPKISRAKKENVFSIIPDEDSSLSSLLTNQSNLRENWVQLILFPRISAAKQRTKPKDINNISRNRKMTSKQLTDEMNISAHYRQYL